MEISLEQIKILLDQQKELVIKSLLNQTGYYNKESDDGNYRRLPIDEIKFKEQGRGAQYPPDIQVLDKYIKEKLFQYLKHNN